MGTFRVADSITRIRTQSKKIYKKKSEEVWQLFFSCFIETSVQKVEQKTTTNVIRTPVVWLDQDPDPYSLCLDPNPYKRYRLDPDKI